VILVTGSAGRLGGRVVELLLAKGHEVVGTDRREHPDSPCEFVEANLCDRDKVSEMIAGAEAVIHLGAIPGPKGDKPEIIYENNVFSTYNMMTLAAEQGLRRVVFSSSAFAVGWAEDPRAFVPKYLPLDEDHTLTPFEPYGLWKKVGESIGEMVAATSSTSVASLRFTNVVLPERQAEFPLPAPTPENPTTLVMWAYADPRDVALAHVLALGADFEGHEAFMIAQPMTRFTEPTVELIRRNFGNVVEIRGELDGNASVISTEKAERVLGLKPRKEWAEGADE
jgi:UDP-glucose 4-epimerase